MAFYPYNNTVPAAPDDPADDQPEMLQDTTSISGLLGQDHVAFNRIGGGVHRLVRFGQSEAAPGILPGWVSDLYSDTAVNLPGGQTWPFWQNAGGSELIVGPSSNGLAGYIMIGAYMFQWGNSTSNGAATIPFSPAFSVAPYFVGCSIFHSVVPFDFTQFIYTFNIITTSFDVYSTTGTILGPALTDFDWLAIGLR